MEEAQSLPTNYTQKSLIDHPKYQKNSTFVVSANREPKRKWEKKLLEMS
jgi:hypothetical protein